ncbi:MAG: hypothetical protein V1659_05865 [Candidatus Woesearchaeota archaeon]
MTNINELQFDDRPKYKPFCEKSKSLMNDNVSSLVAEGRHIIKPEIVMERRTYAQEPVRTNWQNIGTYSSLVQVKHPSERKTRWFNWHPKTETITPGDIIRNTTRDFGLQTTEADYEYNGAPFVTLNKRQIAELRNNPHALPKLREQIWIEVIAAGDTKLFEEYKAEFEAKTGRLFQGNGMGVCATGLRGLRVVYLNFFGRNPSANGADYIGSLGGCVFGVAPEAQEASPQSRLALNPAELADFLKEQNPLLDRAALEQQIKAYQSQRR